MMINKRLIGMVDSSKKHIFKNIVFQWIGLVANIMMVFSLGLLFQSLIKNNTTTESLFITVSILIAAMFIRFISYILAAKESFNAGEKVKNILREKIYKKLLALGNSYIEKSGTAEIVQVSTEGVEQLEIYFGKYLPQFIYSLLAPITLFIVLSFVNFKSALILLLCVPLIPASIIAVQKFAKKVLAKYWGAYTELGDSFLENLQGLTTLKIYKADEHKHNQMNKQAEHFRRITMKVLTMQLNSVTLMDLIAYGGAAIGIIVAVSELLKGNVSFAGCFAIILLAADFFIPLRLLGSFFHIAMNGMAACDKIFKLLDMDVRVKEKYINNTDKINICFKNVNFSYEENREILKDISFDINRGEFVCFVGESGSGKSTIASLITGSHYIDSGEAKINNYDISEISENSIHKVVTLVSHNSYLFKGTVKENLLIGNKDADENMMWNVLEQVKLKEFILSQGGLSSQISEKGSNLSGGQCQRLAIARALLHDTPVYLFDEATSNIDSESEKDIMDVIRTIAISKTVIMISHRLANAVNADKIFVIDKGRIVENGSHNTLLDNNYIYKKLWNTQKELEFCIGGKHIYAT